MSLTRFPTIMSRIFVLFFAFYMLRCCASAEEAPKDAAVPEVMDATDNFYVAYNKGFLLHKKLLLVCDLLEKNGHGGLRCKEYEMRSLNVMESLIA